MKQINHLCDQFPILQTKICVLLEGGYIIKINWY
jgi:hypothetical protein